MMQKEFVPKRRFEDNLDNWSKIRLSDVASKIGDGLHGTPNYKKSGSVFFINGNNLVNGKVIINKETKQVTEAEQSHDDKTLSNSTILMSINGTIGNLAWYNGEKLMLGKSVSYIEVNGCDKKFIYSYLQSSDIYKYFINSLTGSTIKNLGLKAIRDTVLFVPLKEEQQKIGEFFKHLDEMITLQQQKIDKTKALKSAYLAEMFPAEGKSVPKRRFSGFTDEWKKIKIGDISDSFSGGTPTAGNKLYYKGEIPFIRSGEINADNTELFITEAGLNTSSAKLVEKGDILYALYGATSGEVGISQINGAINQAILAIKPKFEYDSYFISQWLRKQKKFIIESYLQGGQGNLSGNIVKQLIINIPNDKKEQQKTGRLFKYLDENISLQQHKLEKLKATKQAYLHEMFV